MGDFCVLSLCPTPHSLRSWWCLFLGWSRSFLKCLESDLAEWNQKRFGKIVCLFAQIFLPNLKAKIKYFYFRSFCCNQPSLLALNLVRIKSLNELLLIDMEVRKRSFCLILWKFHLLPWLFSCQGSFPVLSNPGNWPGMVFRVSNDPLLNDISVKDTTSVCLQLVSKKHIFVFKSGFQILIFLFIAIYFTAIQMPWKYKDSNTHSAVILFFRLVWFAPTFLMKSLGSPVHTVLSAQPQITRLFQLQWQIGTIGKTTLFMTP